MERINAHEPKIYLIPEELGGIEVKRIKDEISKEIDELKPNYIIFDLRNTSFIDSSGIGFLLGRYTQVKKYNGKVVLYGVSKSIAKLLKLSGMYSIMQIVEKEEEEVLWINLKSNFLQC